MVLPTGTRSGAERHGSLLTSHTPERRIVKAIPVAEFFRKGARKLLSVADDFC